MKAKPTLSSIEGTWRFNDNVAENFDKHVNQSIPHYKDIQPPENCYPRYCQNDSQTVRERWQRFLRTSLYSCSKRLL